MRALTNRNNGADVRTANVEFGCERYGLGKNKMREVAGDAGAVIKVGRRWLFDVQKMDAYIISLSESK
jgi:hypothetical protein